MTGPRPCAACPAGWGAHVTGAVREKAQLPLPGPPAGGRSRVLRMYARLLTVSVTVDLAYRFSSLIRLLFLVTRVYLYYALWSAVFRPGQVVAGMDARQAITYSVLAALQGWAQVGSYGQLERTVQDGSVVYLLLRPIPLLRYLFAQTFGGTLYGLAWLAAGAVLGWVLGLVSPPASLATAGVYLASTVLGQLIYYHVRLLFSLTSFWTVRTTGINMLYAFVVELLGGVQVPIWFFPGWLRRISLWLPFQAMASTPLSLYVGRLSLRGAVPDMALQAFWLFALVVLAYLVWMAAERRVVVQGG